MSIMDNFNGQPKNDFSIAVSDSDWKQTWIDVISTQTVEVHMNLVKNQLVLHVRQLKSGIVQDVLFHVLTKHGNKIDSIRVLPAKSKEKRSEYVFSDGVLKDHEVDLSIFGSDVITHKLTFQFNRVNLHSPRMQMPITHYSPKNVKEDTVEKVDIEL